MQRTRTKWTATKYSVLCSDHFEGSCFKPQQKVAAQFGTAMRSRLKPGAEPSIFPKPTQSSKDGTRKKTNEAGCSSMTASSNVGDSHSKKRRRSAYENIRIRL